MEDLMREDVKKLVELISGEGWLLIGALVRESGDKIQTALILPEPKGYMEYAIIDGYLKLARGVRDKVEKVRKENPSDEGS